MNDLFYRLLGIDPGQDTLRADRIFYVQGWPFWVALLALAGLLGWVGFFYHRDGTRPRWSWKGVMVALRVLAVSVLVWMLWQPMLRSQRTETTQPVVAVLIDESRSMGLKDRWQNRVRRDDLLKAFADPSITSADRATVASRLLNQNDAAVLRKLLKGNSVRIYRFGSEARAGELRTGSRRDNQPGGAVSETLPVRAGRTAAEQTRLGNALDLVLQDSAGQPLAGVVVLSDGGSNMGEDPTVAARRMADAKAPIFTIGFGDPTAPRDLSITSILADEVVRKGDDVVVTIGVRQRGFDGRTVPLTLKLGDRTLRTVPVRLGKQGEKQEINISFTPDITGAQTLTGIVPNLAGELTLSNNRKSWPIRIIDKKLRILYVEGVPRWEYRFLKNAILRDKTTQFACLLADGTPGSGGEGNVPIFAFPKDRKQLFNYDIVILGDVPRDFFSAVDLKNIRAFVEERGGSLITIAGENFLPWQYRNTELEAVWPISVPASRREQLFREPFQLAITDPGARNPMMFLLPDVDRNRALWNRLPGMYWCGVSDRAKPGATVLATHPSLNGSDGKIPLMAVQQMGEGTSFMSMVDSTWQWRFRVGDKYFYRFWGQIVRSLTPHELPGANRFVRLTVDRTTYNLGEKVTIRARLLTPQFHPVRVPMVMAEMERTDGQRFPVKLEPLAGAAGVYTAEWLPGQPGAYRATLDAPGVGRTESLTNVVVETSSLEFDQPEQNEALLRRLAGITAGRYLLWSEFAQLPGLIPDRHLETQTRIEHELWDAPLLLMGFVLLLTSEWILRKRKGLL